MSKIDKIMTSIVFYALILAPVALYLYLVGTNLIEFAMSGTLPSCGLCIKRMVECLILAAYCFVMADLGEEAWVINDEEA